MDDPSSIEILPRNSISLINLALPDIHNFSMDHNMGLNPIKCKEMLINLMLYPNFTLRSLVVGSNAIECVSTYKILGKFSGGSRPSDKEGGGGVSKKFFFCPLGLSLVVWSKNRGWAPRTPPLDLPLVFINIKKLARSSTPYVYYVEPTYVKGLYKLC